MKSVPFKTADYLKTRKDAVAYLNAALRNFQVVEKEAYAAEKKHTAWAGA